MKTFLQHLTEAFTRKDIDKFRADAQLWSKNVRRVQSGKDLEMVASAYQRWSKEYVEELVFRRMMDRIKIGSDNESYWQRQLREKVWPLVVTNPFCDRRSAWRAREAGGGYSGQAIALWDAAYEEFNQKRNSIYASFGKALREALKAVDEYFENEAKSGSLPDHAAPTTVQVEGLPVLIVQSERPKDKWDTDPRETLTHLRTSLQAIRKAGFGKYLTHLRFELRTDEREPIASGQGLGSAAGLYNHRSHDYSFIQIFRGGSNVRTITHEIGHHIHLALLSPLRRDVWSRFISAHRVSFSAHDMTVLRKAYDTTFEQYRAKDTHKGYTIDAFWAKLIPHIQDADTREKYRHFFVSLTGHTEQYHEVLPPFNDAANQPDTREHTWKEFVKAASVPFTVHLPSEYASKNEDEAFAEVFAYYVLNTAPLSRITRATFEDVVFN